MNLNEFFIYFSSGYSCRGKIELWYNQTCLRLSCKQLSNLPEHIVFTVAGRDYYRVKDRVEEVERTIWTVNY